MLEFIVPAFYRSIFEFELGMRSERSARVFKNISRRSGESNLNEIIQYPGGSLSEHSAFNLLQQCTKEGEIRQVQTLITHSGLESNPFLGTHIIRLFAFCGCLNAANQAFSKVEKPTVYTWTAIISANAKLGEGERALKLYKQMQKSSIDANRHVYLAALKACATVSALKEGETIHHEVARSGLATDIILGNTLIDMYAKCGSLVDACLVFESLKKRDIVSWGALVAGHVQHGQGTRALDFFRKLQQDGINPHEVIFSSALKACAVTGTLTEGRLIHDQILRNGFVSNVIVGSTLVDMYAKCGKLEEACNLFQSLSARDIVSWNVMMAGYAQNGDGIVALELLQTMQHEGFIPNRATYFSSLKACACIGAVEEGRLVHGHIIRSGLISDVAIGSTIVDMYAKCGSLHEANNMFEILPNKDMVSWSAMIAGYAQHGEGACALVLFKKMQEEHVKPNNVIFSSALKACGSIEDIDQGRAIHHQMTKSGIAFDAVVESALVDMYAKCGAIEEAQNIFGQLVGPDVVSWGAMITGCAQNGEGLPALQLFEKMQEEGLKPNSVIYSSVLKACGIIGAIDNGRFIHEQLKHDRLELDIVVGNALIDMYAKCGSLEDAVQAFRKLPEANVVSWGALITGYAQSGNFELAWQCFEGMQHSGIEADQAAFGSILIACSHAGLMDEGRQHFKFMRENLGTVAGICHYACMIDLLSRGGCLTEAEDLLKDNPDPDVIGWLTLLSASRTYGDLELGRRCFYELLQLDSQCAAGYVLMSNIYAYSQVGRNIYGFEIVEKYAGIWKRHGKVWLKVISNVQNFITGIVNYKNNRFSTILKEFGKHMKKQIYMLQVDLVMQKG